MDVLAYLRLISNPRDAGAFDRVVNYPRRGIGETSQGRLQAWASERGLSLLDAAARAREVPDLQNSAVQALVAFADMIQRYGALARQVNVARLLEQLLIEIEIQKALEAEGPEGQDRMDNVRELLAGAATFVETSGVDEYDPDEPAAPDISSLDLYLQKISLLTDIDRHDPSADAVTLMTLHNAKGLEFTNVFITGLEDGLFPLLRARDEPDEMEEERRLFYVGITRARRKLYLLHALSRRRAGEVVQAKASTFLNPLSQDLVEHRTTQALERVRIEYSVRDRSHTGWSGSSYSSRSSRPASTPFESDGRYIDYSDAQDVPRFLKGEHVRHPQFGRGIIKEISGFGADLRVVIDFESVGRKKVSIRHANLQKEL
jgi:DNA helicase-2/ATP-dependent DNA helicase PcrA